MTDVLTAWRQADERFRKAVMAANAELADTLNAEKADTAAAQLALVMAYEGATGLDLITAQQGETVIAYQASQSVCAAFSTYLDRMGSAITDLRGTLQAIVNEQGE